ncbi:carboxymuconolactone decarboxylase family protein [Aeromonas hydrophila]
MSTRIDYPDFRQLLPAAHDTLIAAGKAVDEAGLDKSLSELVKLRASQLNGCSFCLQYHLNIARRSGVGQAKLDQLAAWRDATVFSAPERAALAWTESLTRLPPDGVPDALYGELREHFSEAQIVQLSVTVATINSWNRLGVALRFVPPAAQL